MRRAFGCLRWLNLFLSVALISLTAQAEEVLKAWSQRMSGFGSFATLKILLAEELERKMASSSRACHAL